jgi:hypothetical protein
MASPKSVREPKPNPLGRLAFRPRTSMFGRRQGRCASLPGNVSRRGNPEAVDSDRSVLCDAIALGATSGEVEERSKLAAPTASSDSPTKPRPVRLGQVSDTAARLLAEGLHAHENLIAEVRGSGRVQPATDVPRSHESAPPLREFRPPAPDFTPVRPLRARRSSMPWVDGLVTITLPAIIVLLVVNLPVSTFWEQGGERAFELASSSSHLMKNLPAQQSELEPRLVAHGSRGVSGEPVLLGLTVRGRADGGVVMIAGLVPGMSLSSGSAVGENAWEVPATNLADTWIGPPENFVGAVKLIAELHLSDATIGHRQSIDIEWIAAGPSGPEHVSNPTAAEQVPLAAGPAALEQVSSPANSEEVPLAAGPAGPEQISVAAKLPEAITPPQQLDQDEIATKGSEDPLARNAQHLASSHDNRATNGQENGPPRNEETANTSTSRRAPDESFYADRQHDAQQPNHAKWQAIRHCWSVGQLVGSSATSTTSCR